MDRMTCCSGMKSSGTLRMDDPVSSPYRTRIQLDPRMSRGFLLPFGAEALAYHDVETRSNRNAEPAYLFDGHRKNLIGVQYENGLFASSLSDLFTRNYHSVAAKDAVTSHYEECFESLEELEAKTIGNLLPDDDDDDLLSGVTDGFDTTTHLNNREETEELDLFSNVGGLELGENATKALQNKPLRRAKPDLHFPLQKERGESGILLQQHQLPHSGNLAAAFSGSLSFGNISSCTDNGTILSPHSSNGASVSSLVDNGVSSCVSNRLPLCPVVETGKKSNVTDPSHIRNHMTHEIQGSPNFHTHSLPEYSNSLSNGHRFGSPSNVAASFGSRPPEIMYGRVVPDTQPMELNEVFGGNCPPRRHIWNNSHGQAIIWPNSLSLINGVSAVSPQRMLGVPGSPHILNSARHLHNSHVGSAPSVNGTIWDQHHAYTGESPDANVFHPGSLGISGNSPHTHEFVRHSMFPRTGASRVDMSKGIGLHAAHHQRCFIVPGRSQTLGMSNAFESAANERSRIRRNESNLSQADNKKQFELDIDRIIHGEDKRTTLMIKNIPNKYTSKMLLAAIDERHKGTYDFIYLPIDFKNKCNVGYAFINMIEPCLIVPFHKTLDGKKWEKFNSEKVATLAYARIQGKAALIAHFQNSSLMNEDKRCRPLLFNTDGPTAGDPVPFPVGTNIRPRPGKATSDEKLGDDYCSNGDASSASD